MLTPLVVAVLGISYLIGYIAARLWKKDSTQWKMFPGFYTFFPAVISILVVFAFQKRWSLGNFSYTKFDPLYLFLRFITPVILYAISLAIQLRQALSSSNPILNGRRFCPAFP